MKKFIAKLTAFMLILNLVMCVPVSAYAEEGESFDADSITMDPTESTVTVTESVEAPESTFAPVHAQSVSVEFDTDQALTPDPDGEVQISEDRTAIEYENAEGATVDVSFDLAAKITETETDDEGNLTDITYDVSLNQQTEVTDDTTTAEPTNTTPTTTKDVDQDWAEATDGKEIKVELSVNGMDTDPTRVEHKYEENGESKTEYYYNEANKTESDTDSNKKYFTVETVKDAAETVANKVVSLWTSFLGIFKVTNDAFENQDQDKSTFSTLDDAVKNADNGSTVEMLRDYSTADRAVLTNSDGKGDDITVDLNGHTYEKTGDFNVADNIAVEVNGEGQNITIKDGKIDGSRNGIYVKGTQNELTLNNVTIESKNIGVYNLSKSGVVNIIDSTVTASSYGVCANTNNSIITIEDTTVNSDGYGIGDFSNNSEYTIKNSTVKYGNDYYGIYHNGSYSNAKFTIIGSSVKPKNEGAVGIYISGSTSTALNTLTITDTEVVGNTAVETKFTNVTVNGGKLSGVGTPGGYKPTGNGHTTSGAALAVTDNKDGKTGGTILINSGYFMGAKDFDSVFQTVKETTGDDKATVTVKGGHYTHPDGLYNFIAKNYAAICYEDGSEYQYEVVPAGFVPSRAGYNFAGYKDADGNPITLAEAYAGKKVAYINWVVAVDEPVITEGNKQQDIIVVEPDANDSSVQIEFNGSTANVTVNAPTGEKTEISEVTVTSVQTLRDSGIDTISISVDKDVTLEMDIAEGADTGIGDRVVVKRDESTLTITDDENVQLSFELDGLKAEVESSVHIRYAEGVVTIYFDSTEVFRVEVMEDIKTNGEISFKLENGVLKLFDKTGRLLREIKM